MVKSTTISLESQEEMTDYLPNWYAIYKLHNTINETSGYSKL